nr:hypothetical 9.8K protein - myxoma virus [Myxoma virus]
MLQFLCNIDRIFANRLSLYGSTYVTSLSNTKGNCFFNLVVARTKSAKYPLSTQMGESLSTYTGCLLNNCFNDFVSVKSNTALYSSDRGA